MGYDANIASTTELGVVQIGSGLSISPTGVLSAVGSSTLLNVYLTAVNYTANNTNCYIGATDDDIIITLPSGVTGKVFIVKNQVTGSIQVRGTGGQKVDGVTNKTLGSSASIMVLFNGTEWVSI